MAMGFGIHYGWAIECAVGSLEKIDATTSQGDNAHPVMACPNFRLTQAACILGGSGTSAHM
eukprot:3463618-Rhodomonas_salina.4